MAKDDSEGREALLANGGAMSLVLEDWLRSVVHYVRCSAQCGTVLPLTITICFQSISLVRARLEVCKEAFGFTGVKISGFPSI